MNHSQFQELLHLSFHGELTDEEQQVLEKHIRVCGACRQEQAGLHRLGMLLDREKPFEITQALLDDARRELRVALRLERSRRPFWAGLLDQFDSLLVSRTRVAVAAAALAFVGFGVGYLTFGSSRSTGIVGFSTAVGKASAQPSGSRITNFRFVQQPGAGNEVEFSFDMVTPLYMKGAIDDVNIQRVMAQALIGDQNPGERLRTVNAIVSQIDPAKNPDNEVRSALIQAAKKDPNVGVRKEALRALQRFPLDNEIKATMLFALQHEENPGIRISVIAYLRSPDFSREMVDDNLLELLKKKMQSDKNNFVRARAKNFYEEVKEQ